MCVSVSVCVCTCVCEYYISCDDHQLIIHCYSIQLNLQVTTSAAESDRMLVRARAAATSHLVQVCPRTSLLTFLCTNCSFLKYFKLLRTLLPEVFIKSLLKRTYCFL